MIRECTVSDIFVPSSGTLWHHDAALSENFKSQAFVYTLFQVFSLKTPCPEGVLATHKDRIYSALWSSEES